MSAAGRQRSGRVIGVYPEDVSDARGTLVITIGGLHGNEPAGIAASRRVIDQLREKRPPVAGAIVALAGNLEALSHRFGRHPIVAGGQKYLNCISLRGCHRSVPIRRHSLAVLSFHYFKALTVQAVAQLFSADTNSPESGLLTCINIRTSGLWDDVQRPVPCHVDSQNNHG